MLSFSKMWILFLNIHYNLISIMQKNIKTLFTFLLLITYALNDFVFNSKQIPSPTQISLLSLSLFLLLTFPKDNQIEEGKVVIRIDKKKYHITYSVLYLQLLFLINNYGIPQNIVEGIILCSLLAAGIYAYIK